MEILNLLEELKTMAEEGEKWYTRFPPFAGKLALDAGDLWDLITEMERSLPREMTEASQLARNRDRIIEEAHEQRAKIIEAAREQAQLMTSNDELVRSAEGRAQEIIQAAEVEGDHIRSEAEAWARSVVERLENYTDRIQATVQKTKKMLLTQQPGREVEEPGGDGPE